MHEGCEDFKWKINQCYRTNNSCVSISNMISNFDLFEKGVYEGRHLKIFRLNNSVLPILFETDYTEKNFIGDYKIEVLDLRNTLIFDIILLALYDSQHDIPRYDPAQTLGRFLVESGLCKSLKVVLMDHKYSDSLAAYLEQHGVKGIRVVEDLLSYEDLVGMELVKDPEHPFFKTLEQINHAVKNNESVITISYLIAEPHELCKDLYGKMNS